MNKNKRIIVAILVLSVLTVMILSLVGCGTSKDPSDVKALVDKAQTSHNYTMELYAGGSYNTVTVVKFGDNKYYSATSSDKEDYNTEFLKVYEADAMVIYYKEGSAAKYTKENEEYKYGSNAYEEFESDSEFMLSDFHFDFGNLVYSEDAKGFVFKDQLNSVTNNVHFVLKSGALTMYEGNNKVFTLKDVGKTKIKVPSASKCE